MWVFKYKCYFQKSKPILSKLIDKLNYNNVKQDYLLKLKDKVIQEENFKNIEPFNLKEVFNRFKKPQVSISTQDIQGRIKIVKN